MLHLSSVQCNFPVLEMSPYCVFRSPLFSFQVSWLFFLMFVLLILRWIPLWSENGFSSFTCAKLVPWARACFIGMYSACTWNNCAYRVHNIRMVPLGWRQCSVLSGSSIWPYNFSYHLFRKNFWLLQLYIFLISNLCL